MRVEIKKTKPSAVRSRFGPWSKILGTGKETFLVNESNESRKNFLQTGITEFLKIRCQAWASENRHERISLGQARGARNMECA